ncbi:TetR family transcriptional regulator [Kribbella orskensis]|uniref:TetR family transcriptional regulator n=1 Tax=Kribbella orskensis TaxID=2512216 RepID=A0ABY2BTQ9_9ACTN|nr:MULTISPECIES: TetR/AcrR family transcriptional regulator [Kribbella]TCN44565.1 TetR family transcriptional regulator [Kribbella sp. VKM Ac-2500]TCO31657.1 TetR family transcriptional regulator [Kribbella orskensis]
MSKGEETRAAVLDEATRQVSLVGMNGLTIGLLAERTGLSKSGLFAHFKSKEQLQVAVIDRAVELFAERVIRPALKTPRGEQRLRELFDRKLRWDSGDLSLPGGCFFASVSAELDDAPPGPVRDRLVQVELDYADTLATVFRTGISEGQFRADADPEQYAFDIRGVLLSCHHASRLLADPKAQDRARTAFEALIRAAKK